MSDSNTSTDEVVRDASSLPTRKRKRDSITVTEIEVNVNAPEPPSKKALRKAKKGKITANTTSKIIEITDPKSDLEDEEPVVKASPVKRSDYGMWIGNLSWSATKTDVRTFITANTDITDDQITRLHMPTPRESTKGPARQNPPKPQNKGFAYVDFSTSVALEQALTLTETLLTGRRVLIKDSKSFEGRPDKPSAEEAKSPTASGKPAGKRIFVGNLGFDISDEDLREHFSRCGEVTNVHVATFEDSGKCKGFAWVEFEELGAGQAAVKGWVDMEEASEEEEGDAENNNQGDDDAGDDQDANRTAIPKPKTKKKRKPRKWWVNRLKGRPLKIEFAEDKTLRYKKRYGKGGTARKELPRDEEAVVEGQGNANPDAETNSTTAPAEADSLPHPHKSRPSIGLKGKRRIDARSVKPGAALAAAPRLTGGIVTSQGTKTTFS